jgi:ribonuclease HI
MEKQTINIFIDGASRNNPGPAGAGVYITCAGNTIVKSGYYLGKKTNNQAEYLALLIALFLIHKKSVKKIIIKSDSELLVKQMNGLYQVRNQELKKIKSLVDKLLKHKSWEIKHVLREKNKIADKLANEGIDSKNSLPESFVDFMG